MSNPRLAAYGVHLFTATGSLCGILSIDAIYRGAIKEALAWMVLSVAIDAADGTLARRARVKEVAPEIDGSMMDNLIDYLNFVVVPALLFWRSTLMPPGLGLFAGAVVCLSSCFQFSHADAKTEDHFFRGFPSYWNVLAFYLLVCGFGPWVNLAVVVGCAAAVFVPIKYIYPSRTQALMVPTLVLTLAWSAVMVVLLVQFPDCDPRLVQASLGYVVYYLGASLWLNLDPSPATPATT